MIGEEKALEESFEGGQLSKPTLVTIKDLAEIRVQLEGSVQVSQYYRTLYYGLKMNQVHYAAVVHSLAFVLRRVLYSLVIVFMVGEN